LREEIRRPWENCFKCHGPDKQKGGLRVDARATIIKGGSQGPAIVPGIRNTAC